MACVLIVSRSTIEMLCYSPVTPYSYCPWQVKQYSQIPMLALNTQRKMKFKVCSHRRQIPYDITYMWNLKYDTNEPIYETETDSQA